MKSYVVTEDVLYLMKKWSDKTGVIIPCNNFFQKIQEELISFLRNIFPGLILIKHETLEHALYSKAKKDSNLKIVSIDEAYGLNEYSLAINRVVDQNSLKLIGLSQRPGFPGIDDQIRQIPKDKPIVLVDDGCFSGDTFFQILSRMRDKGLNVVKAVIGIMINRSNNIFLEKNPDFIVESVYDFDNVIDWLCERDFYIGIPFSGKTVGCLDDGIINPNYPDVSLPYCLPFGNPVKSASIPRELAIKYSKFVLGQSIKLWQEIEKINKNLISCQNIPRLPIGIRRTNIPFSVTLINIRNNLAD